MVWWVHYGTREVFIRGGFDLALDAQVDLAMVCQVPACDVAVDKISTIVDIPSEKGGEKNGHQSNRSCHEATGGS